jgi:methyltransferase (TIGR00027 family)
VRNDRPSGTAYLIAGSLAASGRDPRLRALLPAGAAELSERIIAEALPNGRLLLWALRRGWGRGVLRMAERLILPGVQAHYIVRKRYIEDAVRAAIDEGCRQVVNIGAGFDTLCWRLHTEAPEVSFLEVDHPATQRAKRQALERDGAPPPNLALQPADLTAADLGAVLRSCPLFDSQRPTLFIIEGLLMYLTAEEVEGLFRAIHALNLPATRVVFTFMEPQADGLVNFPQASPLVTWWLRQRGEPFKWGVPRAEVAAWLATLGFQRIALADDAELRTRYLEPAGLTSLRLAIGELVSVAASQD